MSVINTNTAATLTANALTENQRAMNQSMERLSTGSRINSAKDDAAGLAIVSKMDAQITGLNQAVRNANDGIAQIQTVDGAAIEIDEMLQRMRELAVQAVNTTNTASDLVLINKEFTALATGIDAIADTTQFNDTNQISAATTNTYQIGQDANQTMAVTFQDFNLAAGAATGTAGVTTFAAINAAEVVAMDDAVTFTLFDGETLSLSAAETAELASVAGLAQLFNVKAEAAGIAVTASGTEAGGLVLTADVAKVNVNAAASVVNGAVNAGNDLTVTATTTATGADGGVMGADLSAYLTLGANAQGAGTIAALDVAIAGVASQRADFGAWMNRLEHTVDNLTQTSQNTSAARSRIADADYAAETSELARTQIIAQAATAMLSQANQQAQSVLALLK